MKNLLTLGKALNKAEQKNVFGGRKNSFAGSCYNGYYTCDGEQIYVGPCHWPHIAPC